MIGKGELFHNSVGTTFRVLDVDANNSSTIHVFGMDDPKSLPQQWDATELKAGIRSGEYKKLAVKRLPIAIQRKLAKDGQGEQTSPAEVAAERRMVIIAPLVQTQDIYWRQRRGALVAARALELGVSEQTIMTALRLYWRGGMTRDALLANFANCGISQSPANVKKQSSTTRKAGSGKVRGRRTTRRSYVKFCMKDADKQFVRTTGLRLFKRKKTTTDEAIYTAIIAKHYSYEGADGKLVQRPLGERPTKRQITYELRKHVDFEASMRRKLGDDTYENDIAPKTGSSRNHADHVGRYFEIDSTIVDVWIVAEDDNATVIGKATLYLVIDTFSNLIAGFHLSLDHPSWAGAMEAMLSVVADKEALCERWGFEYRPEDWPATGVWPMFWVADRGPDFMCSSSDNAVEGVEGGFVNVPRRRAPRKGRVECGFKLIHVPLKEHVGGYVLPADMQRRQIDDMKNSATRTLKKLGCEILHAIRMHNHRVHKGIKLPARDVYRRLRPVPVEIWKRDYEERVGMLSSFDEDYLRFKLLPKDEAVVTSTGIFFNGLLYEPEANLRKQWLLPAVKGRYKTPITHDRRLVDCLYLHDAKNPSKWTTVHLVDACRQYAGLSSAEFESIEGARMSLDDLADEHNLTLNIRHYVAAEEREHEAKVATQKAIRNAAGRSRTHGGKDARENELRRSRPLTKVLATTSEAAPPAASSPPPKLVPTERAAPSPAASTSRVSSAATAVTASTTANTALLALLNLKKKS